MIQNVYILGANGNVGSNVVKQIIVKGDTDPKKHKNPTRIVGLAALEGYIYDPKGISDENALLFSEKKLKTLKKATLDEILDEVISNPPEGCLIFIDVTAGKKELLEFHKRIIDETSFRIVTANKNPVAFCDYETFLRLTKNFKRYGYRVSVMAGAETISFLQDLKDLGDTPKKIEGCFSGTLGYICSEIEKGRNLSEVVREAKNNGYTEPHPKDDLNGLDVARKLLVLVRSAGIKAEMDDIEVEPFIPEKYLEEDDVEKFLDSIESLDMEFDIRVKTAREKGKVLRYVASYENGKLKVYLREVPKDGPLGSLQGTLNKMVVVSEGYPEESPYSVEAPGAGPFVTAENIRRDLLYRIDDRELF